MTHTPRHVLRQGELWKYWLVVVADPEAGYIQFIFLTIRKLPQIEPQNLGSNHRCEMSNFLCSTKESPFRGISGKTAVGD